MNKTGADEAVTEPPDQPLQTGRRFASAAERPSVTLVSYLEAENEPRSMHRSHRAGPCPVSGTGADVVSVNSLDIGRRIR